MAKPTSTPEWASDETNNTEPSQTQKETGWTPGQDGVSDYDNWFKCLAWKWLAFLNGYLFGQLPRPPACWRLVSNDGSSYPAAYLHNGLWKIGVQDTMLICPIEVPPGSVLTDVRIEYELGHASNQLEFGIQNVKADGSIASAAIYQVTGTTGLQSQTFDLCGLDANDDVDSGEAGPLTVPVDKGMWLYVKLTAQTSGANTIYNATINPGSSAP